jgi:predicted dinucleotide-binding enzyme
MRFGTIGAGTIAQAVGRHVLAAGHELIVSNSRGTESLADLVTELGPGASAGTVAEAATADMVLVAVPWPKVPEALAGLQGWDGRVVIDATNLFPGPQTDGLGDLTSGELVASLVPGAHVVKAFNTLYARYIEPDPRHEAGRQVLFYAGDDADAKVRFAELFDAVGFAVVDAGTLHDGGRLMEVGGGPLSALHALRQD